MIDTLKSRTFSQTMLKHLVLVALFCPVFSSFSNSIYSPDFVLTNAFALLYVISVISRKSLPHKRRFFLLSMTLLLLCFVASSLYVNWKALHWYMGTVNLCIPFLFFITLVAANDGNENTLTLKTLLKFSIVSNLLGLIPYFLGYYGVKLLNGCIQLDPMDGRFGEPRYNWLYAHKSEYAFMLVLFLALMVTYRNKFPKKWMYYAGIAVMAVGLVISNTRTSLFAALFIFVGLLLEQIHRSRQYRRYLLLLIPIGLVGIFLLYIASRQRNLLTLGGRIYIWKGAIPEIRKNPYGIGTLCGLQSYPLPDWPYEAFNCHNVFLNLLLQFSIPSGLCCIAMIFLIICASFKNRPSFLTLGIWIALLIPLNMDWCLLPQQFSIFLLCVYFLFFHSEEPEAAPTDASNSCAIN